MSKKKNQYKKRAGIEPYWFVIGAFLVAVIALYIYHVVSGNTPSRSAFTIGIFGFDVFWYGIFIVAGIGLGSYVVSRLAMERAERLFNENVSTRLQRTSISTLDLPSEIQETLKKRKTSSLGRILFEWGLNPARLGLNRDGQDELRQRLEDVSGVEEQWLIDAPWRQWNPDYVWGGVVWCLVLAVIGARLYHVLTPSPSMAEVGIFSALDYFRNPLQLINLRSGGLGIYGGIVGGAVGLLLYARRHRINPIAWADLGVVGVALGQFIGRWGNFFNQELYGRPTDLPWAVTIDPRYRLPEFAEFDRFHPAFLYESLWNLMAFFVLLTLARRHYDKLYTGDLTALYLVLYATGRIILELFRLDSRTVQLAGLDLGLPVATLVSIIIALPMAALLIWRHLIPRFKK
jgi:phosphatidylglycerol:prolipoprotein diacylglycerol transferase